MTNANNLPAALREHGLFCCWRYERREGADKPTKVPYNPRTGGRAQSTNPDTFAPLDAALTAAQSGYDGLGVGIFGHLGAIDIDHCLDGGGRPSELARDICGIMGAYTEISPSGRGLRILFTVPDGFQYDKARCYINNQNLGLEIYIAGSTNKYVTVTGSTLTPGLDLEERGEQLRAVLEKYMVRPARNGAEQKPTPLSAALAWDAPIGGCPAELDDLALVERAKRSKTGAAFAALWAGDTSGYKSRSEADIALCNALAFWTNRDPARMDRLFRQSGLMREKWDRPQSGSTYGALTIQNAVRTAREGYDPTAYQTAANDSTAAAEERKVKLLKVISAPELQRAELPPVRFLIEGILPDGTSLLTAASKTGKSWMVLDLGLCQVAGRPFMGHKANQCGVLYLALEDSLNRLQDRMNKVLGGRSAPEQFYFTTQAPKLDNGLLETLDAHLKGHPDTRLIIIDTLQKVRGQALPREASYAQDYREMETIKAFMDERGVSVLFVHHNRKMKDDDDPFNMISGTNGIMGAADTIWTITKAHRADEEATLHITGRDVAQSDTVMRFDKGSWTWKPVGEAGWLAEQRARAAYDQSPIVKTVKKLLEQSPARRWDGTAKELMEAGKYIARTYLAVNTTKLGREINALERPMLDYDGIVHAATKTGGNGGKKHSFYYQDIGQFEELDGQEEMPWPEPQEGDVTHE